MAIPFVFGGAAALEANYFAINIPLVIFVLALIAFLAGVGREIMKDVMDFEGDKTTGVKSFPKYVGVRGSNVLAGFFYILAIVLSFVPFFSKNFDFFYLNYYYLTLIFLTDVMFLTTSFQLFFKKHVDLRFYRKFTLVALFLGLLGFLIGAVTG